jgi:hypothetical protein
MPTTSTAPPAPLDYHGIMVHPTVNPDGSDAGGAKTTLSGKIELRLTAGEAFFIRGLTREMAPFRDTEQFVSWVARAVEAMKRFQDRRGH